MISICSDRVKRGFYFISKIDGTERQYTFRSPGIEKERAKTHYIIRVRYWWRGGNNRLLVAGSLNYTSGDRLTVSQKGLRRSEEENRRDV